MSFKSFKPLGVRGAVVVFAVSLALGGLGGVLSIILSDQPGVAGFALTTAMLGLVMAGTFLVCIWWWRHLDEAAREAHKWAWFWGGTGGTAVGAVLLVVLSLRRNAVVLPSWAGETPPELLLNGMLAILLFQTIGYGLAWAWWWWARR